MKLTNSSANVFRLPYLSSFVLVVVLIFFPSLKKIFRVDFKFALLQEMRALKFEGRLRNQAKSGTKGNFIYALSSKYFNIKEKEYVTCYWKPPLGANTFGYIEHCIWSSLPVPGVGYCVPAVFGEVSDPSAYLCIVINCHFQVLVFSYVFLQITIL